MPGRGYGDCVQRPRSKKDAGEAGDTAQRPERKAQCKFNRGRQLEGPPRYHHGNIGEVARR